MESSIRVATSSRLQSGIGRHARGKMAGSSQAAKSMFHINPCENSQQHASVRNCVPHSLNPPPFRNHILHVGKNLRALCTARVAEARGRANAEARVLARVGRSLRLCSLDRTCGEEIAGAVGVAAVERAFVAALRLPSRSRHNHGGVNVQALKASGRVGVTFAGHFE